MQQIIQQAQEDNTLIEILAIASPILIGVLTYWFSNKSKKMELLYQNKIPAFNELNRALVDFKKYLHGLIAEEQGNEYSPYYGGGEHSAFEHRGIISEIADVNAIYLNNKSRKALEDLTNNMAGLCNLDAMRVLNQLDTDVSYISSYESQIKRVDEVIEILYKDLNLK